MTKCSDTGDPGKLRHAGALVHSNDFIDPFSKVRDPGVCDWTVSAAGFVAPGHDAHLVPNT